MSFIPFQTHPKKVVELVATQSTHFEHQERERERERERENL
jgi:hypothetical protein